jgi:DNA repair exonuclease SbcCD ATPase subunit
MSKRTTQKLARLRDLAGQAGANIFERCRLAAEVLADITWVTQTHGGDEMAAMDALETEYFADYRDYITLGKLRQVYHEFPNETDWKDVKYNLAAMEAKYAESHANEDKGLRGSRTSWKAVAEKYEQKQKQLERDRDRDRKELASKDTELEELRCRISELERENAELNGRLMELQRLLGRDAALLGT